MSVQLDINNSDLVYTKDDFINLKGSLNLHCPEDLKIAIKYIDSKISQSSGSNYQTHHKDRKTYSNSNTNSNNTSTSTSTKNSWRIKRTAIISSDISDQDKFQNEINSLLNKLSPKNFNKITQKIMIFLDSHNEEICDKLVDHTIDNIFLKAVMQPIYCPYYVSFIKDINIKYSKEPKINHKCLEFKSIIKQPEKEVENTTLTETEKYDLFCKNNKEKRYKEGYSQFVGELYNKNMINLQTLENSITHYVEILETYVDIDVNGSMVDELLVCICKLILTVYTKDNIKNLNKYMSRLVNIKDTYGLPKRLSFKILDLKEAIYK